MLLNILDFVHASIQQVVQVGDTVVDATAGNGHDTLFLATCVGEQGKVMAFDIQKAALQATHKRLKNAGLSERIELIEAGHEYLDNYIEGEVSAIMFNLGYLPGADKNCTTTASTTLKAMQAGLAHLAINGVLAAVLYPGHEQGRIEAQAVQEWAAGLPQQQIAVLKYAFINRVHNAPYALLLQKQA
ncbi:MAG: methyltransferase domain-containing protein [Snodgrassella sp.]|uniref:class I SAM-dependent methyltransferase n=1 Tax=Snodgrassella sp. TaxID=2815304 RepID=UPI0025841308|nr:class I SAM-dependent methyltransferase [Snodgrassella sp.]MCO6520406.1 methyltransferase domain-containing protein [Snodgrassella sp.]